MISHEEFIRRGHDAQFGKMTKEQIADHFRKMQALRKNRRGKNSK